MRRVVAAVMVSVLVALPATALATSSQHHVTDHLVGALIQTQGKTSTYAFKVHASNAGTGAAFTVDTPTSSTAGKTHGVVYFATGSVSTTGTYRIGTASPSGVVKVNFSGRETGGTGVFRGSGHVPRHRI